jgi:hypothetical protein
MTLPAKRLQEIESEERQRFEEEKIRTQVREKLLDQEPWRRFGKTKFAAYTNGALLFGVAIVIVIFTLVSLGLV